MAATAIIQGYGGGGSGAANNSASNNEAATGGGGAGFAQLNAFPIASGIGYPVNVGTGGLGVNASGVTRINGNSGNASWFNSVADLLANGGGAGIADVSSNTPAGGTGGASNVGDVTHNGGRGGNVTSGGVSRSTGGGGGAGDANNGGDGTNQSITAGTGGSAGGGNGSNGNQSGNTGDGSTYGGGSGGSRNQGGTPCISGKGGDGAVIIKTLLGVVTSATGGTHTTDGTYDIWTFTASGTWTPTLPAKSGFFLAASR